MIKKFIFVALVLVLLAVSGCSGKKYEKNEESENSKEVFYALFGVKYLEKNKNLEFDPKNIETQRDKNKFDKQLRKKLVELLNMPLIPPSKPEYSVVSSKEKYTEEKILIYTSNITIRYAYLLIPKNIVKAPVIMAMHPHNGNYNYGKEEIVGNIGNPDLFYGKELAERGYIVFAIDAPLFGDSVVNFNETKNSLETVEELISQHLIVFGHPPLGIMVQEELIGLDFLTSLDFVDKDNIGCIGHSMGGIRCMYLAALDSRIKTTVLSSSVANLRQNYQSGILQSWLTILPAAGKYTGTSGILALIAPRSLMIIYTEKDPIFPVNETREKINGVQEVYSKLKKEENFKTVFIPNKSHEFPKQYHEEAYKFLDKNLKQL